MISFLQCLTLCVIFGRLHIIKLRSGIAPLHIETGRYESNVDILIRQQKKGIPAECRICPCCFGDVEHELHFLLECPRYVTLRTRLLSIFRMYCNNNNKPYTLNVMKYCLIY